MALPAVTSLLSHRLRLRWPRLHQGIYGDAAHELRKSDHNRRTTSGKTGPRAIDLMSAIEDDHDDILTVVLAPLFRRRYRISLVISRGVLYSRLNGWKGRPYRGSNPHNDHVHISCDA